MSLFYDGVIDEGRVDPECRGRVDAKYNDDYYKCEQYSAQEIREDRFQSICKEGYYSSCFGHLLNNNFKFDY